MKTKREISLKAIKGKLGREINISGALETTMLPLAKCREILNGGEIKYSDEEVIIVRDYLYRLASIVSEQLEIEDKQAKVISLTEHKNNDYAQSNYLCTG